MKQWYEELFENYALSYDNEVFTKSTLGETDFIEDEIGHNHNVKILDIGFSHNYLRRSIFPDGNR